MNRKQYLLTKLAEEASEVAQIALKTQQFGFDEVKHSQTLTNRERVFQELDDLFGILEMLNEEYDFGYFPDVKNVEAKKIKVNKYFKLSEKLGEVSYE